MGLYNGSGFRGFVFVNPDETDFVGVNMEMLIEYLDQCEQKDDFYIKKCTELLKKAKLNYELFQSSGQP